MRDGQKQNGQARKTDDTGFLPIHLAVTAAAALFLALVFFVGGFLF